MRITIAKISLFLATLMLAGGCVSQSEFDSYKEEMDGKLNTIINAYTSADKVLNDMDVVLACESRVDAFAELRNNFDEVDPTRRDEPNGTRRDITNCEAEFSDVAGNEFANCKDSMEKCIPAGNSTLDCRLCSVQCLNIGTWDAGTCPIP